MIGLEGMNIRLGGVALPTLISDLEPRGGVSATRITVWVPLSIRRRPARKTVVTPVGAVQARADPALLKALARAFRWQKMLDEGRYGSISEMAAAEKIERGYLGKVLQLTLLPPWVVEAILEGRQGAVIRSPWPPA